MKKIKVIFILLIIVFLSGTYVIAATGRVADDGVRLREEPNTDCETVAFLNTDEQVEVIEKAGEWYKVTINDLEGYVHSDYLEVEETVPVEQTPETPSTPETPITQTTPPVTASGKSVHVFPLISSTVVENLGEDVTYTVVEKIGGWTKIKYQEDKTGWVRI